MDPDDDAERLTGDPNPRREDARPSPIIEGVASEVREDKSPSAPAAAPDPEPIEVRRTPQAAPVGPLPAIALAVAVCALVAAGALWWRSYRSSAPDLLRQTQALNTEVAALNARIASTETAGRKTTDLEGSVRSAAAAAAAAQAQANQALASAKAALDAAGKTTGVAPTDSDALAQLAKRVAALEGRPDPGVQFGKLTGEIADLQRRGAALESSQASQAKQLVPLQALLNAPKIDVAKVEATTARAEAEARAAALIVAARSLQQQIDAGKPFGRELAAAETLGADLTTLRPIQASSPLGVATNDDLRRSFQDLEGPILAGVKPEQRGGLLDRLAQEAGRLVRVRSVGASAGGSAVDVVARIESSLAAGDVAAALKDREALSASAQAVTASWAAKAQARVAAQAAAQAVLTQAADQLGKART